MSSLISDIATARQRTAFERLGIADRLSDPSFALSPSFDFPEPVEIAITSLLALMGGVGGLAPVAPFGPFPGRLQERISPPFLLQAYTSFIEADLVPNGVEPARNLFFATAPIGVVYPRVLRARSEGSFLMVFDSGMLIYFLIAVNAIWDVLRRQLTETAREGGSVFVGTSPGLEELLLGLRPRHIEPSAPAFHALAESLAALVVHGWSVPAIAPGVEHLYQHMVPINILQDLFRLSLSHELAHIDLGHLSEDRPMRSVLDREKEADLHGLLRCTECRRAAGSLPVVYHQMLFFEIMTFLYRAIGLVSSGVDYSEMSSESMFRLYEPVPARYPHPRTRELALRGAVLKSEPRYAARISAAHATIHALCDSIFATVVGRLRTVDARPAPIWRQAVASHRLALETK